MTVVDLAAYREPVTYTVRLRHYHDGRLAVWVEDVRDSSEDRKRVAAALRAAADTIEVSA